MENTQYTAAPPNTDKALYWYSILVKCARLLDLPDDEPIPSGVLRKVEELAALAPAAPAQAEPEPGTWDYLIEELESGRTAGRIAAMKSNNAVLVAAKARIADLEAALRSVLDQPETAAAYDTMMQRVTDALAGAAPAQAEPSDQEIAEAVEQAVDTNGFDVQDEYQGLLVLAVTTAAVRLLSRRQ